MFTRNKISVLVAEFVGTATLAAVVLAESFNVRANAPWFIGVAAGVTLAIMVLAIGRISGAHINPAVTIGQWTLGKIAWTTAIVYIGVQMLGGAVAWRLYEYVTQTTIGSIAGYFSWPVFFAELIGTFVFTFGIAAAINQKLDEGKAAFAIGASLFIGVVVASSASNAILNPAVALALNSFSWLYVLAPIVGSVLGMNAYYRLLAQDTSDVVSLKSLFVSAKSSKVSNTKTSKKTTASKKSAASKKSKTTKTKTSSKKRR